MTSDSRIDRLGQRLAGVEGELRQVGERMGSLENSMNARFGEMNTRINTLIGVSVGLWITTIGTLIGLFLGTR